MLEHVEKEFERLLVVAELPIGGGHLLVEGELGKAVVLFFADGKGPPVVGDGHGVLLPGKTGVAQPVGGIGDALLVALLLEAPEGVVEGLGGLGVVALAVEFPALEVILAGRVQVFAGRFPGHGLQTAQGLNVLTRHWSFPCA